jgi:hypothetical protein
MERQLGSITHFNSEKGFGFIAGADEVSHWFHIKFVTPLPKGGRPIPHRDDLFYFSLRQSDRATGRDEAFDLELVRRAPVTSAAPDEGVRNVR